jgi:hypothetical protein
LESKVAKQYAVTESLKRHVSVAEEQLSILATEKKKTEQVLHEMKHRLQEAEQVKSQAVNQDDMMESLKLQLCVTEEQLSNDMPFEMKDVPLEDYFRVRDIHALMLEIFINIAHEDELYDAEWSAKVGALEQELETSQNEHAADMAAWQAKYDQTKELKMAKRELEEDLAASRKEHATKMEAWQAKYDQETKELKKANGVLERDLADLGKEHAGSLEPETPREFIEE